MRIPIPSGGGRCLAVATAIVVATLGAASSAGAVTPDRTVETIVIDEPIPVIACANGKSAMATLTITRTVTTFFDQDGSPLRQVRHTHVVGQLSAEDGSRSVPYGGRIHRVFDYTTGLATVTGRSLYADLPGPGADPATAGRYVFDPESDGFVLERGRTPTESEAQICAYLYPSG